MIDFTKEDLDLLHVALAELGRHNAELIQAVSAPRWRERQELVARLQVKIIKAREALP